MKRYDFQTLISLGVTMCIVNLNIYYPWTSKEALIPSLSLLVFYNLFDMIIGFKVYLKNDKATLFHHIVVGTGTYFLLQLVKDNYTNDLYRIARWGMIAEVTSFCNNIRIILRNTSLKWLTSLIFGIVFLIGRGIMTFGLYYDMQQNSYFWTLVPMCIPLIILNMHWSELIIQKILTNNVIYPTITMIVTRYHSFIVPYLAIYAHENVNNYLATLLWIYFTISVITFYNISRYVSLGICFGLIILQITIL